MQIENHSPLPVHVERNGDDDDRISIVAVCAVTCDIVGATLRVIDEQPPLSLDARSGLTPDTMWHKERAVSVCATGFVYAPGGEATEATAMLRVGDRDVSLTASGPRVWRQGAGGRMVSSAPRPFARIPMAWSEAFGGTARRPWSEVEVDGVSTWVPGHAVEYPPNPGGKGFYLDAKAADEHPLPLLEHPEERVRAVDDWPRPRCFAPYPLRGSLRAELVLDEGKTQLRRSETGRLATKAIPALTFEALSPETPIAVVGMRPADEVIVLRTIPPPVAVYVAVGPQEVALTPHLDEVDIDAEALTVRFLFRATFAYDLIRHERRRLVVHPSETLEALRL